MKFIFLFFVSLSASAGYLNLSSGETATILSNQQTQVSCAGGSGGGGHGSPIVSRCDSSWSDRSCLSLHVGAPCDTGKICMGGGKGAQTNTVACDCKPR